MCIGNAQLDTCAHTVVLFCTRDGPVAGAATNAIQNKQKRNIHSLSGIGTRDPSSQGIPDLHLRPHGYRDRRMDGILRSSKEIQKDLRRKLCQPTNVSFLSEVKFDVNSKYLYFITHDMLKSWWFCGIFMCTKGNVCWYSLCSY